MLYNGLPGIWGRLSHIYVHRLPGADEVCGESWQPIIAIRDKGNGLILCE